ncbi:MAG: hypothetical protein BWY76_01724 [bacterium ADurb.Bin429]|nr:MAG: hypothetical protein BWY76_01724 [bacterium ADurb.Bin429]
MGNLPHHIHDGRRLRLLEKAGGDDGGRDLGGEHFHHPHVFLIEEAAALIEHLQHTDAVAGLQGHGNHRHRLILALFIHVLSVRAVAVHVMTDARFAGVKDIAADALGVGDFQPCYLILGRPLHMAKHELAALRVMKDDGAGVCIHGSHGGGDGALEQFVQIHVLLQRASDADYGVKLAFAGAQVLLQLVKDSGLRAGVGHGAPRRGREGAAPSVKICISSGIMTGRSSQGPGPGESRWVRNTVQSGGRDASSALTSV